MKKKSLNRIKTVLSEKERNQKWLASKMNVGPTTVSYWCTNRNQPSLETLFEIAKVLDVDVRELIQSSK